MATGQDRVSGVHRRGATVTWCSGRDAYGNRCLLLEGHFARAASERNRFADDQTGHMACMYPKPTKDQLARVGITKMMKWLSDELTRMTGPFIMGNKDFAKHLEVQIRRERERKARL